VIDLTPRRSYFHEASDDPALSGHGGLVLVGELVARTGLIDRLDAAINGVRAFKQRQRGLTAGELLVALAESNLIGGDHLIHLDELRADSAGAELRAVAKPPAPTTAGQLLQRLCLRQCQAALAALAEVGNHLDRELGLPLEGPIMLDLDSTGTEVYGGQELAEFSYAGVLNCGSLLATWSQRRRVLAAELRPGAGSDKPLAARLLLRALKALPQGHGQVSVRADSGFYCLELMEACRRHRLDFSISVPRYQSMWKARRHTVPYSWHPALGMPGAEIAEVAYTPGGWKQEALRLLIRRVRISAQELSRNPRSRRRRTIPRGQLQLALSGRREHVYAYSFILTDRLGDAAEIELEHRQRAHIEERIKDAKNGCGLHHLPMRSASANRSWQTASIIATNLLSMISAVQAQENQRALVQLAAQAEEEEDLIRPPA
jgi:hypothetical protein